MGQRVTVIDAFADRPFAGNPAAVCILEQDVDDAWMQAVAAEINLSETAFLRREEDRWRLRWFTPVVEVDLCGHATLAAAHLLWQAGLLRPGEEARFLTRSGPLSARQAGSRIEMDFPADPCTPAEAPPALLKALAAPPRLVARDSFDYLVLVDSEAEVRALQPDFALLAIVPTRGVIVTARASTPGYDFVSRFFAPAAGIPEDPVTGSSHCCLAPFWSARLNKRELLGYQASKRGGSVYVRLDGDRVILGGSAATVLRGELAGEVSPPAARRT